MARRGVAGGREGATHELTEERQGTFHFTMGPYSTPVLEIQPGDRVMVETRDAFDGMIRSESDLPQNARDYLAFIEEYLNVPIALVGVGPGRDQVIWMGDRAALAAVA